MQKIKQFPDKIPQSVGATISPDAPVYGSNYETCEEWLNNYGTNTFRTSFFYKGPLLFIDSRTLQLQTPTALLSINAYKNNVKRFLLSLQGEGEKDEWQPEHFLLYDIHGLRKSARLQALN